MPREKDETLELLGELLPSIAKAIVDGHQEAYDYDAARMHKLRRISRRNNVRDHIVDHLRAMFHGKPGVHIEDHDQTTNFHFHGTYCCRVKKADECGDVELAKTQASFDFQCNETTLTGMELPEIENLYLSYIDTADPRTPIPALISPCSEGINWMEELAPPAAGSIVEITPPAPPDEEGDELVRIPQKPHANENETE